ncbi:hypothetical protein RKD26_000904 [Streptomyces calvus]|uniref:hypothetical protein n=1 Tax=Streptomyces calvus TaxID=67282 RepID=UPI003515CDDD
MNSSAYRFLAPGRRDVTEVEQRVRRPAEVARQPADRPPDRGAMGRRVVRGRRIQLIHRALFGQVRWLCAIRWQPASDITATPLHRKAAAAFSRPWSEGRSVGEVGRGW